MNGAVLSDGLLLHCQLDPLEKFRTHLRAARDADLFVFNVANVLFREMVTAQLLDDHIGGRVSTLSGIKPAHELLAELEANLEFAFLPFEAAGDRCLSLVL